MKLILAPLLLISFTAFAASTDCQGLGDMISKMERELQEMTLGADCKKVLLTDVVKTGTNQTLVQSTFDDAKCNSLSSLESEIALLEGQIAVQRGLLQFSKDLSDKHEILKDISTQEQLNDKIKDLGKDFKSGLKTAHALESLLFTTGAMEFINALKARAGAGLTPTDWAEEKEKFCPTGATTIRAYCPNLATMAFDRDTLAEIGNVLNKASTKDLEVKDITALQAALKINQKYKDADNKEVEYSYDDIVKNLATSGIKINEIGQTADFSKDFIKGLKKVPSFKAAGDLDLVKKLNSARTAMETKGIIDSFKFITDDVINRNNITVKSKLLSTMASLNASTTISADHQAACKDLLTPDKDPKLCLEALSDHSDSLGSAYSLQKEMIRNIQTLLDNTTSTKETIAKCLKIENIKRSKANMLTNADCNFAGTEIEATLAQKKAGLDLVRQKILMNNKRLQDFRNFTIDRMQANKCEKANREGSLITDCGGVDLTKDLTPAVTVLSGDILKVAVMFVRKGDDEDFAPDMDDYCDRPITDIEKRVCTLLKEKKATDPAVITHVKAAPTSTGNNQAAKDAQMAALTSAVQNISGAMGRQYRSQSPQYNYYSNNNTGYSTMPRMSISDSLTYGAVYYGGYGGYYPMNNSSPYLFNSSLLNYMGAPATNSNFSYSAVGSSSYGAGTFMPTYRFD